MADNSFDSSEGNGLSIDDPEIASVLTEEMDHPWNDEALSFGYRRSVPIDLPSLTEENFVLMVEEEKSHLPKDDYLVRLRTGELDMSVRRLALDWILKAHSHYGFGELTIYLAMNYLDRFLSLFDLPEGTTWAAQLLAVACFSIGAKMAEIRLPPIEYLQVGDPKYVFEANTIERMELIVLTTLNWRMHSYTPYAYIDYFLRKINVGGGDGNDQELAFDALIGKAVNLILSTIKGIDFLEFKPSEIAAAVAIFVAEENIQAIDTEKAMSGLILIEKERVLKCHKLLKDLTLMMMMSGSTDTNMANASVSLVPHSPNGVLEAASLNFRSDEGTVGSCPSSSNNTPDDANRIKLDTETSPFGNNSQK
nr:cyclin-D2-1-like isoform X2 [Coffea arabica]